MAPFYTLYHQVRLLDETLCGNGGKYSTGDVLFSVEGKRTVLGKPIAEGGEGSVFVAHSALGSPLVAKLYHPTQRTRWCEQKLRLMCSRPIRSPCRTGVVMRRNETMRKKKVILPFCLDIDFFVASFS